MNRWSALAVLLAIAGALALRVPKLGTRPLHNDEAVNAVKVSELWQQGRYAYDPDEYHGPALHYATLPVLWLSRARHPDELSDATLRLAPVVFGVALILPLLLFADGLGRQAVAWAAIFTAVSPAMVFYSRYFIHEMLLVFFTALTLGAGWRYLQARSLRRAVPLSPQPAAGEASAKNEMKSGAGENFSEDVPRLESLNRERSDEHRSAGAASSQPSQAMLGAPVQGELRPPTLDAHRGHEPRSERRAPARREHAVRERAAQERGAPVQGEGWEVSEPLVARESQQGHHPSPSVSLSVEGRGKPEVLWAVLTGVGLGLMIATKETFVITLAAIGFAGILTVWWTIPRHGRVRGLLALWNWKHAALALGAAFILWLLLFSSFFTNSAGLLDSVRTYLPWLQRAGGHSPHLHSWDFYLHRLAWFHPAKGPIWSEGFILALAAVGAVVSLRGCSLSHLNGVRDGNASDRAQIAVLHRFLALYTIILTALYSAISYKTPWCLLNFYLGMILLAGIGAAALTEFFRARPLKVALVAALLALTLQLSWQAWRASFAFSADWRNPYVYAQTAPDLLNLVQRAEGIARVAPKGYETVVKIIAPENDYWPLPWYLRRFKHVGWYDQLPADPYAPIVVVSSKLNARLDEKSDRKWIMAGITELRPRKFFELYVELELWRKYVETLPRDRD